MLKQGREYFVRGGLSGAYKKLYDYEQITDDPKNCIAIDEMLAIIDDVKADANKGYMFDMVDEIRNRVLALKGVKKG